MKTKTFSDNYPIGPCPDEWPNSECECGWKFNEAEVVYGLCSDGCEICEYCSEARCPNCGQHLCCGGCI